MHEALINQVLPRQPRNPVLPIRFVKLIRRVQAARDGVLPMYIDADDEYIDRSRCDTLPPCRRPKSDLCSSFEAHMTPCDNEYMNCRHYGDAKQRMTDGTRGSQAWVRARK